MLECRSPTLPTIERWFLTHQRNQADCLSHLPDLFAVKLTQALRMESQAHSTCPLCPWSSCYTVCSPFQVLADLYPQAYAPTAAPRLGLSGGSRALRSPWPSLCASAKHAFGPETGALSPLCCMPLLMLWPHFDLPKKRRFKINL